VAPKLFVCPSTDGQANVDDQVSLYYDFGQQADGATPTVPKEAYYKQVCYGLQIPFGASAKPNTDPAGGNRQPLAADRGPYSGFKESGGTADPGAPTATYDLGPDSWMKWNSPNHGGWGTGEGQNMMYADAHCEFEKKPLSAINDNIYTQWNNANAMVQGADPNLRAKGQYSTVGTEIPYGDQDTFIYP
jgi:hypothetical protein